MRPTNWSSLEVQEGQHERNDIYSQYRARAPFSVSEADGKELPSASLANPPLPGSLCADCHGFSLHAKVLVPAGELERLEHLCRYVTRPPIATQRLALAPDGRVVYGLKRHWRDGTSAVSFDPLTFIERLAALVPSPRAHQLTYHGVLAPASAWRDLVVPKRAPAPTSPTCGPLAPNSPTAPSTSDRSRSHPRRSTWAELLHRVFAVDVLICPHCGGPRRFIAQLTDPIFACKILAHLGRPTEPARPARLASPPTRLDLGFGGPLDGSAHRLEPSPSVDDCRLQRKSSAWSSYPPR